MRMLLHRPFAALTPTLDGDVLAVLAGAEASFTGGQLARLVPHASEAGVRQAAKRLVAQGLVLVEQVGRAHQYTLNREHLLAGPVLEVARAEQRLFERVREQVDGWAPPPAVVVLFGSAARREMTVASDLDLLVVADDMVAVEEHAGGLARAMTAWTGNDTRPVLLSPDELRESLRSQDPFALEVLADGRVLWGPLRYLQTLQRDVVA